MDLQEGKGTNVATKKKPAAGKSAAKKGAAKKSGAKKKSARKTPVTESAGSLLTKAKKTLKAVLAGAATGAAAGAVTGAAEAGSKATGIRGTDVEKPTSSKTSKKKK